MSGAPRLVPLPDLVEPAHAGAAAFALGALRGGNLAVQKRGALRLSSVGSGSPTRIMVVEPDERCRSLLHLGLGREGFEVLAVGTAEDAIRELASGAGRGAPAMIVIEADLPGEDGFALCGQLRADRRTADLPIILMSRGQDALHRELATGAGADDFLPKPLFVNDVVALAKLKAGRSNLDPRCPAETEALPLAAILRGLLAGMRAGRIELADKSGELAFRRGRVHSARFGPLQGEAALTRMLLLAEGAYTVTFGPAIGEGPMHYGLRDLCTNVLPQLQRWQQLMPLAVPLDSQLALDFQRVASVHAELPRGIERVMGLADGRRSVREIVIDSPLAAITTLQTLTRLYAMAVLVPVPGTVVAARVLADSAPPEPLQLPSAPVSEHWFDDADSSLPDAVRAFALDPEPPTPSIRMPAYASTPESEPFEFPDPVGEPPSARPTREAPAGAVVQSRSVEEIFFDEQPGPLSADDDEVTEPGLPTGAVRVTRPRSRTARIAAGVLALSVVGVGLELLIPRLFAAKVKPALALAPTRELRMPVEVIEPAAVAEAPSEDPEPEALDQVTTVQLGRASALYDAGKPAEAARVLEALTQAHPNLAEAWLVLGLARFDLRDARGAEAAAQKSLRLDSSEPRTQLLLASVYQELKDRTRERVALQQYLNLAPAGPFAGEARQLLAAIPEVAAGTPAE